MRITKPFFLLVLLLVVVTGTSSAYISENSRQGSEAVFPPARQGSEAPLSFTTAGFLESEAKPAAGMFLATKYHGKQMWMLKDGLGSTIALTNRGGHPIAKIGYDAWGNMRWPDKPGHGVPPCKEGDLDGLLDRFEGNYSFGLPQHDAWLHGRHFSKTLTPYLFTGRRFDAFTQQYFNRNRYYQPKFGRFTSSDPIGFAGGRSLWVYGKNNPVRFRDPFGLVIWGEPVLGENVVDPAFQPWPGRDVVGVVYWAATNLGRNILVWKANEGFPVTDSYWCHGYTFGGEIQAGPRSPFSGESVSKILQDEWEELECPELAQIGDIAVFSRPGMPLQHSGKVLSINLSPNGKIDYKTSVISAKNGWAPVFSFFLEDAILDYGEVQFWGPKGKKREGCCPKQ